jgi:putative membrane protein
MHTLAAIASTHWHDGRGWDGPPWPAFFVAPLLLATAFLAGVLIQRSRRPPGALQLVAERYARGEIDEEEYRQRATELRRKR